MATTSHRFFPDTRAGNVFIGSTAVAGVALPAYNATAHTFCLWNPAGSGKSLVPISLDVGYSDTTGAAGTIVLSYQTGVGAQVATGSAITAATLVTPINGLVGGGNSSVARFAPATITFAAATSLLMPLGMSQLVTTATTATQSGWTMHKDFSGELMISPGVAVCVAGNIALLSKFLVQMTWEEISN